MDPSDFEFFSIILQPSSSKLRLPEKFAKWLKGHEPGEVKLREEGDCRRRLWEVEVEFDGRGQMYLARGWDLFAQHYNMQKGDFMVFSYDGGNMLTVKLFDPTMCRRTHGVGRMDPSVIEFFSIILQPSSSKLWLSEKFAKWLEGREPAEVKLREEGDRRRRLWEVEVEFDGGGQMYLARGWDLFTQHYNMQKGDLMVFSYDGGNMLTVKLFDSTMCRRYFDYGNGALESLLDQFCVLSKGVQLNDRQESVLKDFCVQNKPEPPLYICSVVKSHIEHAKGKMYFNHGYTENYLQSFLTTKGADIEVYYNNREKMAKVFTKIGENNRAIMTRKWTCVTKEQNWKAGDIIMFWFRRHGDNNLQIIVDKI